MPWLDTGIESSNSSDVPWLDTGIESGITTVDSNYLWIDLFPEKAEHQLYANVMMYEMHDVLKINEIVCP